MDSTWWCIVALLLLLALAAAWALVLRAARCPGWPIVSGAIAGILLGPSILGRVLPLEYERLFEGGGAARQQFQVQQWFERNRPAPAPAPGAAAAEDTSDRAARAARIADAAAQWDAARWAHQQPLRAAALIVVVLALFIGGARSVGGGDRRQRLASALSIGAWSAALPGGLAFLSCVFLFKRPVPEALLIAAALAMGPWAIAGVDRAASDGAEFGGARVMQTAGRIASALALAACAMALLWRHDQRDLLYALPLLALPLGWIAAALLSSRRQLLPEELSRGPTSEQQRSDGARRAVSGLGLVNLLLLPALAALVAIKIDLFAHFSFWLIVVIVLLSDDGRWLGAYLGAMLPGGRPGLRTMRLVMGAMAAGPTQLAIAASAAHAWLLDGAATLALLLGALVMEVTAPARRGMAARIAEAEEQIERPKQ